MTAQITLPSSCDLSDVSGLRDAILAHRGQDLDIDASAVERFNALGLQVLAAADRTWRTDGHTLRLTSVSDRLTEILTLVNLDLPGTQS